MRARSQVIIALMALLLSSSVGAAELSLEPEPQGSGHPVLRSLFLPGWGQLQQGRTLRGTVWTGGTLLLGFGVFFANMQYNSAALDYQYAKESYERALADSDLASARFFYRAMESLMPTADQRYDTRRNLAIALGVWWGANILDAWLFERKQDKTEQASLPGHLGPVLRQTGAGLAWSMEF